MQTIYDIAQASWFNRAMQAFDTFDLVAFIALACFLGWLATRPPLGRPDADEDASIVLVATLRDSFAVSALYLMVDLERSWGALGDRIGMTAGPIDYARLFAFAIESVLLLIIGAVVVRRLLLLNRWLDRRRGGEP